MTTLTIHLFPISSSFLSPLEFSSFPRSPHRSKRKLTSSPLLSIGSFSSMVLVYFDLILDYFEPSLWLLRHVQLVHPLVPLSNYLFPLFLFLYSSLSLTFHPFPVSIPSLAILNLSFDYFTDSLSYSLSFSYFFVTFVKADLHLLHFFLWSFNLISSTPFQFVLLFFCTRLFLLLFITIYKWIIIRWRIVEIFHSILLGNEIKEQWSHICIRVLDISEYFSMFCLIFVNIEKIKRMI